MNLNAIKEKEGVINDVELISIINNAIKSTYDFCQSVRNQSKTKTDVSRIGK
jgi:hypothetical protein